MVPELQVVAVAAFLIWGLISSLCDVLAHGEDEAKLVSRKRGRVDDA